MSTQLDDLHTQARRAIEAAERTARRDLRRAAECLAQAKKLGASQQQSAAAIGKSKAWVSLLLKWRAADYSYPSPFHPPSQPTPSSSDKRARTRRPIRPEASQAMQARAQAVEAIWRRKHNEALTGSRDEFEAFYRGWGAKASLEDRKWAAAFVEKINSEMERKAA